LRKYRKSYGYGAGFYDLSQDPSFRARACKASDPLFTLTTNSSNIWSIADARLLSGNEIAAAQGLPSHHALGAALGLAPLDFGSYKRTVWSRLVGNGMSTSCIGAVLSWVAAYAVPSLGDVPSHLGAIDDNVVQRPLPPTLPVDHVSDVCELPSHEPAVVKLADPIDLPSTSDSHDIEPAVETWIALGLLGRLFRKHPSFVDVCANLSSPIASPHRQRDLFPLPIIERDYLLKLPDISDLTIGDACDYFLGVIGALNWLYGYRGFDFATGKITAAQRCAHGVIVSAGLELHGRLRSDVEARFGRGWGFFEAKGAEPRLELVASAVAVPDCAATCNPSDLIGGELGRCIRDASVIFC